MGQCSGWEGVGVGGPWADIELDLARTGEANSEGRAMAPWELRRLRRLLRCFALADAATAAAAAAAAAAT